MCVIIFGALISNFKKYMARLKAQSVRSLCHQPEDQSSDAQYPHKKKPGTEVCL